MGLAAALDVWALTRQLRDGHFDRFRRLAVAVKCWARQLGDGSSLGEFGARGVSFKLVKMGQM